MSMNVDPITVSNTAFCLEKLSSECEPLQFLRELTQNAIEAIQRSGGKGKIVWDYDDVEYRMSGIYKLSVTDTGVGMSGAEIEKYIKSLFSSGGTQAMNANFGVGAKISALTRNRCGLVYHSWRDGHGVRAVLEKSGHDYGLRKMQIDGDKFTTTINLDDEVTMDDGTIVRVKPKEIDQHGTRVTLMGNAIDEQTLIAPSGAPSAMRWISHFLQTRYFDIPEGIEILCREYAGGANSRMHKFKSQKEFLAEHSVKNGVMALAGAKAHWWVLDENYKSSASGTRMAVGHVAALFQNEMYEVTKSQYSRNNRLLDFGIAFGRERVVIYIEPDVETVDITANTARTMLLMNSEPLPWNEWGAEFSKGMPEELEAFIREQSSMSHNKNHTDDIRTRLREVIELYKLSRFRVRKNGTETTARGDVLSGDDMSKLPSVGGGRNGEGGGVRGGRGSSRQKSGLDILMAFKKPHDGDPLVNGKSEQDVAFPSVQWISVSDGTREVGFLEDRAACYNPTANLLQINADFRVFTDTVERWVRDLRGGDGFEQNVKDCVQREFELVLTEVVLGMREFQNEREWTMTEFETSISPEALTCAVMPRYAIERRLKTTLRDVIRTSLNTTPETVEEPVSEPVA